MRTFTLKLCKKCKKTHMLAERRWQCMQCKETFCDQSAIPGDGFGRKGERVHVLREKEDGKPDSLRVCGIMARAEDDWGSGITMISTQEGPFPKLPEAK